MGMKEYCRSDLVCEYGVPARAGTSSTSVEEGSCFTLIRSEIGKAESRLTGQRAGHYVTFFCDKIKLWEMEEDEKKDLLTRLSREIRTFCARAAQRSVDASFRVLVVGIGNADITPDAVGPRCAAGITVTGHLPDLHDELFRLTGKCRVFALFPGVLGQTGVETLSLVRGAVEACRPHVVIVVDALAARSVDRLATVIQLGDGGLSPGSGIGNCRRELSQKTLDVPVISLGIPTVVDSATLVADALQKAGIDEIPAALESVLESGRSFVVAPRDSDRITKEASGILSAALDLAFSLN